MISAVILTKNEEQNIVDCIESVSFCDEIIIIDDYSTDRTVDVAKNLNNQKIKILYNKLEDNFSYQRNFGLQKAKGEWVLFLDADERITEDLKNEILKAISSQSLLRQNLCGFYLRRIDFMWGKILRHGEAGDMKLLRFARKGAGEWKGKVHEVWRIKGNIGEFKSFLMHYPHNSIKEFLAEVNTYTTIRAQELYLEKIQVGWWEIILYPKLKFARNYILKLGYLDGTAGFVHAAMMSFHSFLVRGKLWLLWNRR